LGATRSKHAATDIRFLAALAQRTGKVFTTEPIVAQAPDVPRL
jgi:hypothetical protein